MRKKFTSVNVCLFVLALVLATVAGVTTVFGQTPTTIRFYAHPGFDYITNPSQNQASPYFRGGPLVVFVTSQITDKISVAGELNMHYMATTGAEMELERMYIKYDYRNYLNISAGRMYSPIGFWNVNYNFGLILQPNISRPKILNPTHDGGFIQTRDTGLQFSGDNIGKAGFFYRVLFANGIGRNGGILGTPYNLGSQLAYTVQLGIEPVEGLRISASGVINDLPAGSLTQYDIPVPEAMKSTLFAASISHMSFDKKFEFIAEGYSNAHNYSSQPDKNLTGAILYMGYKATSKLAPYIFAEFLDFPDGDTYYPSVNPYTNQSYVSSSEYNLGLRYRVSSNVVLKGELNALNQDQYGWSSGIKTQVAIGF